MAEKIPALTVGLEEELFLVHKSSLELCTDWPTLLESNCQKYYPNGIVREFITSQVELITPPCRGINELAHEQRRLRQYMLSEADASGLGLMASSTHPTALWRDQISNDSPRYAMLADALQTTARRMLVGGMHIHVGIEDEAMRFQLAKQIIYFLPYILALSTSSPFWSAEDTGLNSYRLNVINGLPRSGIPPMFETLEEYQNYVNNLVKAEVIENSREFWWDVRMNARFPTVEIRIADTCTYYKDALGIAALIQALMRYLSRRMGKKNTLFEEYRIAQENRWRAQRYSLLQGSMLSAKGDSLHDNVSMISELLQRLADDALALGSEQYLKHCYTILKEGTSADKQRTVFKQARQKEGNESEALHRVKRFISDETKRGLT